MARACSRGRRHGGGHRGHGRAVRVPPPPGRRRADGGPASPGWLQPASYALIAMVVIGSIGSTVKVVEIGPQRRQGDLDEEG